MKNDLHLHFRQSQFTPLKLFFYLALSIVFLTFDQNYEISNKIRFDASYIIKPIYSIAAIPSNIYNSILEHIDSKSDLLKKNELLEKKIIIQSGILQKIPSLQEENKRLKKLLDSSATKNSSRILMAELIKVNLSPFSNKLIINKGEKNNLFLGQVAIDSIGLLGQVSEINKDFSVITLISDPSHALLAVNARTNKRVVISGTGDNRKLKAKYISLNEDVKKGDILITSGLDNIFPEGYLIGQISKVNKNLNQDFQNVDVVPSSSLSLNREVMLLW
ncbi:MAG: rod shape-determining protein MreC [Gammaproteobacteria bacterium]